MHPGPEQIANQLNDLSMQEKPKKRKPRHKKNKQKETRRQEQATSTSFDPSHDQHAAFPAPLDMASHQPRRQQQQQQQQQQQEPNLVRYLPYDSFPESSYRSSAFTSINASLQNYPDPVAPPTFQPMNRHPSSFFVPSYAPSLPTPPPPPQHLAFYAQSVPFFSQPFLQPELPIPTNPASRLAARQSHTQQEDAKFFRSDLFQPSPPLREPQDPETRSPKPSDKRSRQIDKLLRPTPSLPYLVNSMVTCPKLDRPKSLLVVLDLNGVLAFRKKRTRGYCPRPNLGTFLDYLFANHHVMIWSSGMPGNVERIIGQMMSYERQQKLVAIWSRDKLRLPDNLFAEKVQVYKQLSWIWEDPALQMNAPLGGWSQRDTVLVDDSIDKAAAEPHNLIEVDEFINSPAQTENKTLLDVIAYLEHIRWYDNVSAQIRAAPFVASKA